MKPISRCSIVRFTVFVSLLACAAQVQASSDARKARPNIIVYMVDDLGWNHIGVKQSTLGTANEMYQTPNLERLAAQGLSFTHAYSQPNCAPTRAAMLTGQYPARVNNNVYVVNNLNRFGKGGITKEQARFYGPQQSEDVAVPAITVAEALKENGYATAHIGKYHAGGHEGGESTMPENAGFDLNIGGNQQGHQPTCFGSQNKQGQWQFKGLGMGHFDRYAAPYNAAYLEQHGLPKSLLGTKKHISDALGDAMEVAVKQLAAGESPFYLQFHTYAVHGPVKARPDLKAAALTRVTGAKKDQMADYVGFIASVDANLGRIFAVLEDPDGDGDSVDSIFEQTIILFTSDNGGTHTDNLPLRGEKGMFTEGGIRVPLIVSWPGVIPPNTITDRMVHTVDYYPTYLELAGNRWQPPADIHPLDGQSFADVLRQSAVVVERDPIFYLFPGYMDVRAEPCAVVIDNLQGKRYKLYYIYESNSWELYCLTDDPGEQTNCLKQNLEIAETLSKKIDDWLGQSHPTWQPKYPLVKKTGQPAGPPPVL